MTIAMSRLRSVLSASVLSLALVMPAAANGPGPAPTGPQVSPISGSAALQPCPIAWDATEMRAVASEPMM